VRFIPSRRLARRRVKCGAQLPFIDYAEIGEDGVPHQRLEERALRDE
jgi:hypothetical protein